MPEAMASAARCGRNRPPPHLLLGPIGHRRHRARPRGRRAWAANAGCDPGSLALQEARMPRRIVTRSGATRGTRNVSMALLSLLTLAAARRPIAERHRFPQRPHHRARHRLRSRPARKARHLPPCNAADLPVVVFFYGGALEQFGSASTYPFVAATLARRGNSWLCRTTASTRRSDSRLPARLRARRGLDQAHMAETGGTRPPVPDGPLRRRL